ncbi:hypothetical protein [Faecalicatena contorta]|uniref:hypothetical protein n=1 Tax=Faecalicatena contorta TaxID=39482 RepID=UPI0031DDE6E6
MIYENDESSKRCEFCGGNLIRRKFCEGDSFPDYIIPFAITLEQAKEKLQQFAKELKDEEVKRQIIRNIDMLTGFYLPYRMVRGPVDGRAERDLMGKTYTFNGYVDGAFVNSSEQLDNELLQEIEPFDMSGVKQFEYGYIAGHRVKLNTLADARIQKRVLEETGKAYKPYIDKVLQSDDTFVVVNDGDFLNIPVLIPVYIIKSKKFTVVMNAQTGKIAVPSSQEPEASKRWMLEPTLLSVASVLITGWIFHFDLYAMGIIGTIAALIFFTGFGQDRNEVKKRLFHIGEGCEISEENKNPLPNTPVFYEREQNRKVPVELHFYSFGRVIKLVLEILIFIFLPAIIALPFSEETGNYSMVYGAAWYVMAGGVAILYYVRGIRNDLYNHPILYTTLPNGKKKLYGTAKSRRVSIFSMFGFGKGVGIKTFGNAGVFIVIAMIILLIGSVAAIVL